MSRSRSKRQTPPSEDELVEIDPELTAQQQRFAQVLEQLGETAEVLEDLELGTDGAATQFDEIEETFSRRQAAKYLGVTEQQFYQLWQHPDLRSKNQSWSRTQLDQFKSTVSVADGGCPNA
jgi:hypothetical protein